MAGYRSRSRSYSPRRRSRTPPRDRSFYEEEPRDRHYYRDRRSQAPSGLLLRNLPLDTRPEDLRIPFERFGPVKDIYLPKNYHTGEPRGFGFVKFRYAEDAAEAKQRMNHKIIGGREVRIVYAEENRKTPREMRRGEHVSGRSRGNNRRRSLSRSPKHHYRSYSRSPSPARSREAKDHYHSPALSGSRSGSPPHFQHHDHDYYRDRVPSKRSPSTREDVQAPLEMEDSDLPPSRSRGRSWSGR